MVINIENYFLFVKVTWLYQPLSQFETYAAGKTADPTKRVYFTSS